VGFTPGEVFTFLFQFIYGPGVDSASTRNLPAGEAYKFTAICEPTV
jgi:hypothetical protein